MKVKTGDTVLFDGEGFTYFGKVTTVHNELECDIEFFGGSSTSPVSIENLYVISEKAARFLDQAVKALPTDEDGNHVLSSDLYGEALFI